MPKTILVTDSLFIFDEHVKQLEEAGYEVERLDKPQASEKELIAAVKGKVGYILGGIEKVTDKVIESADSLKAIVFTGSDWRQFIPGHELATKKGVAIGNAPGASAYAVAEYSLAMMLAMTRNIFDLGRIGEKTFQITPSLQDSTVGLIGMGSVASTLAGFLQGMGVKRLLYWSRSRKAELEDELGLEWADSLEGMLKQADIVSVHVPKSAGLVLGETQLSTLRDGALLINTASPAVVDIGVLLSKLKAGKLRAAFDDPPTDKEFLQLPNNTWFASNETAAFNTKPASQIASDMSVNTMLNLLKTGNDEHKAN